MTSVMKKTKANASIVQIKSSIFFSLNLYRLWVAFGPGLGQNKSKCPRWGSCAI